MKLLIGLLVLAIGIYATPQCNNITVTGTWYQPPTLVSQKCASSYTFLIPTGYYANVKLSITDAALAEDVSLFDYFGPRFDVSGANREGASINFPSSFNVVVEFSIPSTSMKLEVTVTAKKLSTPTSVTQVGTNANKQPTVIYLKDWVGGTSYTFTSSSSSSKIAVLVDPHFLPTDKTDTQVLLNNVFITEGGVNKGTVSNCFPDISGNKYCLSNTKEITLTLVESANLLGAILVTDYDNIKNLDSYGVQYVPISSASSTGYAVLDGDLNKPGAITIIGEKNGATPITIRQLKNFDEGGQFTYFSGGPVANYGVVAASLSNSNLPKSLSGSLNTFMISQGHGNVIYSI